MEHNSKKPGRTLLHATLSYTLMLNPFIGLLAAESMLHLS